MDMTEEKTRCMTHAPQSVAELIAELPAENIRAIAKYGCCAFSLLWALGFEIAESVRAIETLSHMIDAKAIGKDCTVYWTEAIRFVTGKTAYVEFLTVSDEKELKNLKGRIIVRYEYGNHSHWVGVENGKVAYNSLKESRCVSFGHPTAVRIIHINED